MRGPNVGTYNLNILGQKHYFGHIPLSLFIKLFKKNYCLRILNHVSENKSQLNMIKCQSPSIRT